MNQTEKIHTIQRVVSEHYRIPQEEMLNHTKVDAFTWPRMVAMKAAYDLVTINCSVIGSTFRRHRSAVANGIKTVRERCEVDKREEEEVKTVMSKCRTVLNINQQVTQ